MFYGHTVVGITNSGFAVCGIDFALNDIFGNVNYYVPWIQETVKKLGKRTVCVNNSKDPNFDPR